jgi:hypothetical protein
MDVAHEYERMREFERRPGYQMQLRAAIYTVQRLEQLNSNERKAELTRFATGLLFLSKRAVDPGFYRFVRKMELKRKNWYWSQIKELGYLILLDVLHPESATPTQAAKKPKIGSAGHSETWVTERHLRRIRRNYPEVFFTPLKVGGKKTPDKRKTRYSTIFSDMSDVDDSELRAAVEMLATMGLAELPYLGKIYEKRAFHAALRMVDPDDVIGLQKFWEFQKASLRIITSKFGHATHEEWLIPHIERGTLVLDTIYQFVDEAVALRWYRTVKSETKKARLLRERHHLSYSKEDRQLSRRILSGAGIL